MDGAGAPKTNKQNKESFITIKEDNVLFWKKVTVGDQERVLVTKNGRFVSILEPGEYRLWTGPTGNFEFEVHNLRDLVFSSNWADFLVAEKPETVERNFLVIETGDRQVAVVSVNRKTNRVIGPGKRVLFWKASAKIDFDLIDAVENPQVPAGQLDALARLARETAVQVHFAFVDEAKVGLLVIDNRVVRTLGPGSYGFWAVAGAPRVEIVDLRRQPIEVTGQEILTRDKVSLRVNILADYQVVDPVKAKQAVKDFAEHLYHVLQIAVRQTLAKRTLEEVLSDRTDLDETVAAQVRTDLAGVGIRVGAISLKDIVPPGEVRAILNHVVAAEKQAQANVIRRREETAATRSLLNTAKLLEDNPILLRLKELETLEKVVEKVDRITVTNGLNGLLDELVTVKRGS